MLWQVRSSTIEITRQYPAKTPPNKKTYLAYPAILKKINSPVFKKNSAIGNGVGSR